MIDLEHRLEHQLLTLLSGYPRGATVERLRSLLDSGGSLAKKHNIVRSLRSLAERQLVEIDPARCWKLREPATTFQSTLQDGDAGEIRAIPCHAAPGARAADDDQLPEGQAIPDMRLLMRLLPYYQEALRVSDGGSPLETLGKAGERFVLLRPDAPWWPLKTAGKTIRVQRTRLPGPFLSLIAKNAGRQIVLGYPLHAVTPPNGDTQPFFRPVTTFRCRFNLNEEFLEVFVPPMSPSIVREWLVEQRKYGGWDTARLRSWLLLEDETAEFDDEDDIDPPNFIEAPLLASRLAAAAGRETRQDLDPVGIADSIPLEPKTGIYNALVLMTDSGGKYTRSSIKDFDSLQAQNETALAGTALGAFFGSPVTPHEAPPVLHSFPLSEAQLTAARSALSNPLSVITGPPGTGKSQVIAAIMMSAAAAGKSVLFAARQHRALDAVQERLESVADGRSVIIRANSPDSWSGFKFADALTALQTRPDVSPGLRAEVERELGRLSILDKKRWLALAGWQDLKAKSNAAAKCGHDIEQIDAMIERLAEASSERPPALLHRIRSFIISLVRGRPILFGNAWQRAAAAAKRNALSKQLGQIEGEITGLRQRLESLTEDPVTLSAQIAGASEKIFPVLLDNLDRTTPQERETLVSIAGDAALRGRGSFSLENARLILKHFPLWAVSTLGAGSRIPAFPGLFDIVIFDEAAQTDIASAIPLLFRARTAVIVGDPMQLAMISDLDPSEEAHLLKRFDLFKEGIGRFAQGRTSLFDFAASSTAAVRHMLVDHFRCHPDITSYFNEAFYGRKLATLTEERALNIPRGYSAGLHWTNVTGPVVARTAGNQSASAASDAEAKALVKHLAELVATDFQGTIGVVTFFDYQAKTIGELVSKSIPAAAQQRHAIKIFTANKFQGDERDVILLSLSIGPVMPAGAKSFVQRERRLFNVAVSRARAICHIFGDLDYALTCGVAHIESLAKKTLKRRPDGQARQDDRFESPWETKLYQALVKRGYTPIPQHPVGGRFLDLALIDDGRNPPVRLDIEVDGVMFHTGADGGRLATDLWRDHQLRGLGWKVLRFWVYELRNDMEKCVERIDAEFKR